MVLGFTCGGVASRLTDPAMAAYTVVLNRWLDALGPEDFTTFVSADETTVLTVTLQMSEL